MNATLKHVNGRKAIERIGTDKLRFYDVHARTNAAYVHTVEVTTPEAATHFFTLWVKSANDAATRAWVEDMDLDANLHDPGLFHTDDPSFSWIDSEHGNPMWRGHYHVLCSEPPRAVFLEPFAAGISPELLKEIRRNLVR